MKTILLCWLFIVGHIWPQLSKLNVVLFNIFIRPYMTHVSHILPDGKF